MSRFNVMPRAYRAFKIRLKALIWEATFGTPYPGNRK